MPAFGAFGKIPAEGEFVRVNASSLAAHEFDDWLQEGIAALVAAGGRFPAEPFQFVFRGAASAEVLVGVVAPSGDSRGRVFPLAVFAALKAADVARCFAEIPTTWARALEDARGVLVAAQRLTAPQLAEQMRTLAPPSAAELDAGRASCQRLLAGVNVGRMREQLFGDPALERHYYGFATLVRGCSQQQGREPTRSPVVLDCPTTAEVPPLFWLELARRLLGWPSPPSFLWREPPTPQLLLSLGPCSAASLPYLVGVDRNNPKVWPLVTDAVAALAQAKASLPPKVRLALDDPAVALDALVGIVTS